METRKIFLKNLILLAFVCLICPLITLTTACSYDEVSSISVSGKSEISVGNFDYEDYTVQVTYNSGRVDSVPLDKTMLSDEDNLKFFCAGEQTLTINYLNKSCEFGLKVCLYEFSDLKFKDAVTTDGQNVITATYSGQYITAEVFKNYPEGTEIYYANGNRFIKAGEYTVTAIVSRRNYVTERLTAKVVIEKAEYDMDGVEFKDCQFDYDGNVHSAEISGDLPEGVSVTYPNDNNKKINAGTYTVTAQFTSNNDNYYLPITSKTATMVINKKKYDAKGITFSDAIVTYDTKEHTITAENVPNGLYAEYSVKKASTSGSDSKPIEGTSFVDAGKYLFTAKFRSYDPNYADEDIPSKEATLEIVSAEYDTSGITLESQEISYDGKPHSLSIKGGEEGLPKGVSVYGGYYEKNGKILYKDDDEYSLAEEVTDYGVYKYTLVLEYENDNYKIPNLTAILTINKIDYDLSNVTVEKVVNEDGSVSVNVKNIPSDVNNNPLKAELYYYGIDVTPVFDENGVPVYVTEGLDEEGNQKDTTHNYLADGDGKPLKAVTSNGEYKVVVVFVGQNNQNYNYLSPKTFTFYVTEIA